MDVTTKKPIKHSIEQLTSPCASSLSSEENLSDGGEIAIKKKICNEKSVSYTEMIASAILTTLSNMMTLQEIYSFLNLKYPVLQSRGKSWKNSVRHTLSLNEWFVKIPRMEGGKCCYWSIHPIYLQRFRNGDFQKQRKSSSSSNKMRLQRRMHHIPYDFEAHSHHWPGFYPPEMQSSIYPTVISAWSSYRSIDGFPYHMHTPSYSYPGYQGQLQTMVPTYVEACSSVLPLQHIKTEKPEIFQEGSPNENETLSTSYRQDMHPYSPPYHVKDFFENLQNASRLPDFRHGAPLPDNLRYNALSSDNMRYSTSLPASISPVSSNTGYVYANEMQKQFQMRMEQHTSSQMLLEPPTV